MEALVPSENLSPFESFPTDAASVSITGVGDDALETPDAVSTRGEAAEAMARVETLVVTEVFRQSQISFAVSYIILKLQP